MNDFKQLFQTLDLAQVKSQFLQTHADRVHMGINESGQNWTTLRIPNGWTIRVNEIVLRDDSSDALAVQRYCPKPLSFVGQGQPCVDDGFNFCQLQIRFTVLSLAVCAIIVVPKGILQLWQTVMLYGSNDEGCFALD